MMVLLFVIPFTTYDKKFVSKTTKSRFLNILEDNPKTLFTIKKKVMKCCHFNIDHANEGAYMHYIIKRKLSNQIK